jgi:hypothetical protein
MPLRSPLLLYAEAGTELESPPPRNSRQLLALSIAASVASGGMGFLLAGLLLRNRNETLLPTAVQPASDPAPADVLYRPSAAQSAAVGSAAARSPVPLTVTGLEGWGDYDSTYEHVLDDTESAGKDIDPHGFPIVHVPEGRDRRACWGIAAPGRIAGDFAASVVGMGGRICAVGAGHLPRKAERAAAFAALFGANRSYGSYEALAADDEVSMVYIAAVNCNHFALAKLFLEAGGLPGYSWRQGYSRKQGGLPDYS